MPTFLFVLNPPTLLVVPVGPIIMLLVAMCGTHFFAIERELPLGTLRKIGIGAFLGAAYVLLTIAVFGLLIGGEWWAWAFVIAVFVVPGGLALGSIIGVFAGNYCERVIRGEAPPPEVGRLWVYSTWIAILIFFGLPILSWRLLHG
ncbi:MAG: hypothetical protein HYX59_00485 [Elusimicrobia bacterium]|nr:hypothetical protein [Elusimicrobiota bacterium]